jgi:hypothetical protein
MNNSSTATVTLPDITDATYDGVTYIVIKQTANQVDITTQAADKILLNNIENDTVSMVAGVGERTMIISNGTYWYLF